MPGPGSAAATGATRLSTVDGVRLAARVLPGGSTWVVLAHGFGVRAARPSVQRAAAALAAAGSTVLVYDARGHGGSTGTSTLGVREALDVDAAVRTARERGAAQVVTVGFSMGGTAVLRHAGLQGREVGGEALACPPDAVVAVSTTSTWDGETAAVRRLRRMVLTRSGRLACRALLGARVAPGFDGAAPAPLDVVGALDRPLLLVHGTADHYFGLEHAHALHARAGSGAELWVEPGFGHAEDAASPDLLARLAAHLPSLLRRSPA